MSDDTPGGVIRYTADGSLPTASSTLYTEPITVTGTAVSRAAAFVGGVRVSDVVTETYLINPNTSIPIVSFVMDPYDLDPHDVLTPLNRSNPAANTPEQVYAAAIYWNSYFFTESLYQDYFHTTDDMGQRPVNITYWEPGGVKGFQVDAGLSMHGGASRQNGTMKKSFRVYFRNLYGPGKLTYPLFSTTPVDTFNKLVLRANYNDGWSHSRTPNATNTQTVLAAYVRDALNRRLRRDMGDLAGHDGWCMVYLNGEAWGLYNTTDRFDDGWFKEHTGNADWDLLELSDVGGAGNDKDALPHGADSLKEGDATAWQSFVQNYVTLGANANPSGLSGDAYYQAVQNIIDVENFTNYMILNIWNGNCDWPHHNGFVARERIPGGKWIFLDWDTESAFGGGGGGSADVWGDGRALGYNALARCTDPRMRLPNLLRQLLGSPAYRNYFAQRMDVLLNTTLDPAHINEAVDELAAMIRPAMPFEKQVWQQVHTVATWETALVTMKNWNSARTDYVRAHVRDHALMANVNGWTSVTVNPPPAGGGRVTVQTIVPEAYPWTGTFFTGVPLVIEAIPDQGYVFSGWSDGDPSGSTRTLTLATALTLNAQFELDGTSPALLSGEFGRRNLIALDFDRPLDTVTALVPSNYSVSNGGGQPVAVSLRRDDTRVLLEFASPLTSGVNYTVTASSLRDAVLNPPMPAPASVEVQFVTPAVSITEIMYNTAGPNDVEWIELHNTTNGSIDISGWYITDSSTYPATSEGHALIPAGTILQAGEYAVVNLWNNPDFGLWQMPPLIRVIHTDCPDAGSLSNSGDNLALYTAAAGGTLVDGSLTVIYPDKAVAGSSIEKVDERFPWGTELSNRYNFEGATVELGFDTALNVDSEPLASLGTPGRANNSAMVADDPLADDDGDGIPNGVEDANGNGIWDPHLGETDWQSSDTDGDGVSDGLERLFGTDPLNPDDCPELPATSWLVLALVLIAAGLEALRRHEAIRSARQD